MAGKYVRKRAPRGRVLEVDEGFVSTARSAVGTSQDVVQRIGDAIIGGDFTGNARGQNALDIQIRRFNPTEVASGVEAVALGKAIQASGTATTAIGSSLIVSGYLASAFGFGGQSLGQKTITWQGGIARVDFTANLPIPFIVRRDDGGQQVWPTNNAGVLVVIYSHEVDLKQAAPSGWGTGFTPGAKFWCLGCGLEITQLVGLVSQPRISLGDTTNYQRFVAARVTTQLTAVGRQEYYLPEAGSFRDFVTTFGAYLHIAASATVCKGRFWWSGLLVENQP